MDVFIPTQTNIQKKDLYWLFVRYLLCDIIFPFIYIHICMFLLKKYLFFHISFSTASFPNSISTSTRRKIRTKSRFVFICECVCVSFLFILNPCFYNEKTPGIISEIKELINKFPYFVLFCVSFTSPLMLFFKKVNTIQNYLILFITLT